MNPIARRTDVIVQDIGADTLVYDRGNDEVHSLNSVAAFVFKRSDGETSIADLTAAINDELGVPADDRVTVLALQELEAVHLLERPLGGVSAHDRGRLVNRRQATRTLMAAAFAVPTIVSIVAPTPLMAISPAPRLGNPGNHKPVGRAGETPNNKPGWGEGDKGQGDVKGNAG